MQTQTDYSSENQPNVFQARPLKEDGFLQPRQQRREPFGELANNSSPSKLQPSKRASPAKALDARASHDQADKRTPKKDTIKAADLPVFQCQSDENNNVLSKAASLNSLPSSFSAGFNEND